MVNQLLSTDDDLIAWLQAAAHALDAGRAARADSALKGSDHGVTVGDLVSVAATLRVSAGDLLLATVRGRTSAFAVVDTVAVAATSGVELEPARRWACGQPSVGVLDCAELVEVAAACAMSVPRLWQVFAEAHVLLPDSSPEQPGKVVARPDPLLLYAGVSAQLREARLAQPDLSVLQLRTDLDAVGLPCWESAERGVECMPLAVFLELCVRLRVSAAWVLDRACGPRARSWWPINTGCPGGAGDELAVRSWSECSGWRADPTGTVWVHQGALPALSLALGLALRGSPHLGPVDLATGQPLPRRVRHARLRVCPE